MDTNWSKSEGRSPKPEKGGSINQAGIAASQRATWLFLLFIRVHWWLNRRGRMAVVPKALSKEAFHNLLQVR